MPDQTMIHQAIFPSWLHELATCPSTNTWAIEQAAILKHGDVVFTRQQTAGRGQQRRVWYAPAGVLTASFVLERLPAAQLSGLSLAAGLAVINAIEDLLPDLQGRLRLKWSNDVFFAERKLAGILCEAVTRAGVARVVVGVGLNRSVDFTEQVLNQIGNPISLHQISEAPAELALLERLRHCLLQVNDLLADAPDGIAALLPELQRRDLLLARQITLELDGERISGEAAGIDASGRLLLRLPDQQIRSFTSGRIVEIGPESGTAGG